jgi:hypothetical protein
MEPGCCWNLVAWEGKLASWETSNCIGFDSIDNSKAWKGLSLDFGGRYEGYT